MEEIQGEIQNHKEDTEQRFKLIEESVAQSNAEIGSQGSDPGPVILSRIGSGLCQPGSARLPL